MTSVVGEGPRPCQVAGCTFGQPGGKCVNGISSPTEECPDYTPGEPGSLVPSESAGGEAGDSLSLEGTRVCAAALHPATALDERLAYEITRSAPTSVVVVSGIIKSGKTTLITSIYDRFNAGPIGEYGFAGSRTLHAFEQSCHDSRDASERENPETLRTPFTSPGEQRFLHLRVSRTRIGGDGVVAVHPVRDLLITDLHGEKFERVRDDSQAAAGLAVLPRADHFVQLVDGAMLSDAGRRHQTIADARRILQSCFHSGVISNRTIVHIVATKWDLVRDGGDEAAVRSFWERKVALLRSLSNGRVGGFAAHITAARTPLASAPEDWGVGSLLTMWIEDSCQIPDDARHDFEFPSSLRQFDRFGARSG